MTEYDLVIVGAAAVRLFGDALATDVDPVRHAHTRCIESVIVRTSDAERSYLASRHAIEVFSATTQPPSSPMPT